MITYFFAVFPPAAQAVEAYAAAVRVQASQKLRGNLIGLRRMHLTVHFVERRPARDAELEQALLDVGDAASLEPFDLTLAQVTSFAHGLVSPSVFLPGSTPPVLSRIAADIGAAASRIPGVPKPARSFKAHVTFLRSRDRISGVVPVDPIVWQPASLSLAAGIPGAETYDVLRSWPLSRGLSS